MIFQFNLIEEPWIPIVDHSGIPRQINLREALVNAHRYRGISASLPHTNAALYRILLAVLHRVFGPRDDQEWQGLWEQQCFEAARLDSYLNQCHECFDLFSEKRPFFQNRHPKIEIKPANALLFLVAGGDADTLFDHNIDIRPVSLTPQQAALALVTAQSFSLAGLCHPQLGLVYTDAPCARAAVFLLQGKNLFESLMLNLVRYNRFEPIAQQPPAIDLPAWEMENPYQPERSIPLGYLDYLTWQNRRLMLFPSRLDGRLVVQEITTAPGLTLSAEQRNPMHHYHIDKEGGKRLLRFNEGRALWRDSAALLNLKNKDAEHPQALRWAEELVSNGFLPHKRLQLAAYGMCTDPGKQKVYFYRGDQFTFSDDLLTNRELVVLLDQAMDFADEIRKQIGWATRTMAELKLAFENDQKDGWKAYSTDIQNLVAHWDAESNFWNQLEIPFHHFLDMLPIEPEVALDEWKKTLRRAALNAFETTVSLCGTDTKALKAAAKAQIRLLAGIKRVLEGQKQED